MNVSLEKVDKLERKYVWMKVDLEKVEKPKHLLKC